MKKLLIITSVVAIFTLTACTPQSERDINEFVSALNAETVLTPSVEEFKLTDGKRYSVITADKTLLCLYADENSVIIKATLTNEKPSEESRILSERVLRLLCRAEAKSCAEAIKRANAVQTAEINGYLLTTVKTELGQTLIINKATAEENTNDKPTLKRHIEEEDISRPVLSEAETSEEQK